MKSSVVIFAFIVDLISGQPLQFKIDAKSDWKIVGGSNAAVYGNHNCGGSILNSEWILNAAHCVVSYSPEYLSVVVASTILNEGGSNYNISRIISHEDYNTNLIQNDVAVLRLSRPLKFDNNIQPILLESENIGSVNCVISGWGRTSYPGNIPNDLQYIELRTITLSDCQSRWIFNPVVESQNCTLTKRGEGVCHGDSGGPLVANGKQIGIVSWGSPCANGIPDVYTRVSSFLSWIEDAIHR